MRMTCRSSLPAIRSRMNDRVGVLHEISLGAVADVIVARGMDLNYFSMVFRLV